MQIPSKLCSTESESIGREFIASWSQYSSSLETNSEQGCIKMFFRQLRDTVIPSTSYNDFLQAVEESDEKKLIQSVFELPAPHRDTLAYIILHLQKVAENTSKNQMPAENLATVLAPEIIEHSNLIVNTQTAEDSYKINTNQTIILLRLLKVPSEFWNRFTENNMSAVLAAEARTPGSRTALLSETPGTQRKQPKAL
uniref:Rho-GAP domain-containing protein n=1 Tax=Panagrolaimus davidi TaxID=227884 RepID=A0A914QLC7_9BILA